MNKIIFINNLGLGGAERVVSRLFTNVSLKNNTILWTLNQSDFYVSNDIVKKSFFHQVKIICFLNAFFSLLFLKKDFTVQSHLNIPILLSSLAKFFGANFYSQAVHCFAYSSFIKRRGTKGKVFKSLFSFLFKYIDFHIFKSHEMIDDFEETFGWKPSNYTVIYNPYDISLIRYQSNINNDDFKINNNIMNVAIVGRFNQSKRLYDVLEIAKRSVSFAHFHFFGDGPLSSELQLYIRQSKIDNVTFYGSVDNPFHYIRKCGFYLSASEAEGFPNALVESMISGAIPIHSNCRTGPKEILTSDYKAYKPNFHSFNYESKGFLFEVGDINSAVNALDYVFNNQTEIKCQISNNIDLFVKELDFSTISVKYCESLGIL